MSKGTDRHRRRLAEASGGKLGFETLCVHGSDALLDNFGAVATPIYQSATFAHPGIGATTGFDYSRGENPTREQLEWRIADLEGADFGLAFASGMAAVTALLSLLEPGDRVVAGADLYGGTNRLFNQLLVRYGIEFSYAADSEGVVAAIEAAAAPADADASGSDRLRLVFIETPTNPMMNVFDIAAISEAAHAHGALLAVDNTFLTPCFQQPLALGADIVVHSGSKYLGGHNDAIAGFLAVCDPGVAGQLDERGFLRKASLSEGDSLPEKLRFMQISTGAALSPFESFLMLRGIKTLPLRMERMQANASVIAEWLAENPLVGAVHYPGLPSHPGYALSARQATGHGAMIAFTLHDAAAARQMLERVRIIQFAESLGGTESLLTYPMLQTHADVPVEERERLGINDRLLRLSVGIESCDDLLADLEQALR